MNPRLTDIPLHADQPREAGLQVGYFDPPALPLRWFYLFLGFCIGIGVAALFIVSRL